MPRVVFDKESKTRVGFEVEQRQQKCERKHKPNLQSAVLVCLVITFFQCDILFPLWYEFRITVYNDVQISPNNHPWRG